MGFFDKVERSERNIEMDSSFRSISHAYRVCLSVCLYVLNRRSSFSDAILFYQENQTSKKEEEEKSIARKRKKESSFFSKLKLHSVVGT